VHTLNRNWVHSLSGICTHDLGDLEDNLNTLVQTVLSGHSSSSELPEKFMLYIENCNKELSVENVLNINKESSGLACKILRDFCCYSISKFNKQLNQYRVVYPKLKSKVHAIVAKQADKMRITEQIANRIETLGGQSCKFLQLVQHIDHLNFLNDNVDVKYSFKSWPGLIHWNIFANAIKNTSAELTLTERGHILINK